MKLIVRFAKDKTDLDKVVQRINQAAKQLGVTFKINSKNRPNYLVDPSKGLIINRSNKNQSIHYQNYTKIVSVIKDLNNNDAKLIQGTMEDLKSQYKSLITKLTDL